MPTPTLPNLLNAAALALSDVVSTKTGIRHIKSGMTDSGEPNLFTTWTQLHEYLFDLVSRFSGGCVALAGLNVGVYPCEYKIGGTDKTFAGVDSQALTASATNYLYLDTDQTLKVSTSAWPGTDHFRIAKVTTNGSTVTALVDERMRNFQIGIVNAWYAVAAAAGVDLNGNALQNVGELWPSASTELTLASDAVTPTRIMHSIDTQADAAADDLVTLTADAAKVGRLLIVRCENAARVVTIKSTGNIKLKNGNLVLDDVEKFVLLQQHNATQWTALSWNFMSFGAMTQDVNFNSKKLYNVGMLALQSMGNLVIAADAITVTGALHKLSPESGVTDNLKTITPGSAELNQLLLIAPNSATYDITLLDGFAVGGDNIFLSVPGSSMVLSGSNEWILLLLSSGSWYEITRSRRTLSELVGTGQVIPYAIGPCFYAGTPALNQETWNFRVLQPFRLRRASGRVKTAPSGGSCIVHVNKNGASVFATDAAAVNIAVGTLEDVSDTVDVSFATGDILSVKVTTVNAAADLTVGFDCWVEAIASA